MNDGNMEKVVKKGFERVKQAQEARNMMKSIIKMFREDPELGAALKNDMTPEERDSTKKDLEDLKSAIE